MLQRLGGLALAGLARELIPLFEATGVRVLVFKGPALAALTCGDLGGRGGGDLDLLVDPEAVETSIAVLEGAGFRRVPGYAPRQLQRWTWRYVHWSMKGLPLARGPLLVDLHWALTNVQRQRPGFEAAWWDRVEIPMGGRSVPTLSLVHALDHLAAHALNDRWRELRALVDLVRLMRLRVDAAAALGGGGGEPHPAGTPVPASTGAVAAESGLGSLVPAGGPQPLPPWTGCAALRPTPCRRRR